MRRAALHLALVALALICLSWPAGITSAASGWQPDELNWYGISQRRFNETRVDAGLPLLAADSYLWGLAHERARDMLVRRYLSHTTPEGFDAGAYMRKDGVRFAQWDELRADDTSGDAQDTVAWRVVEGILNDRAGRAAVTGDFNRMGVAMAASEGRRVYVVLLAKTAPPPPPPATARVAPAPPPAPATSVADIIRAAARRYGVDPEYLVRVARCESNLDPRAYNPAGPYIGLFQFLPATFYSYGGKDIYSAYDQSDVAARMFSRGLASHWPVCSRR